MPRPYATPLARTLARALAGAGLLILIAAPGHARAMSATAAAPAGAATATTPAPATATSGGTSAPSSSTPQLFGTTSTAAPPTKGALPSSAARSATPAGRHRAGGLSTAAIVIAVIAGLLALGCAAWAIARARAFEPHWLLSARHAMAEAGFRASSTWSEFSDWARLGR